MLSINSMQFMIKMNFTLLSNTTQIRLSLSLPSYLALVSNAHSYSLYPFYEENEFPNTWRLKLNGILSFQSNHLNKSVPLYISIQLHIVAAELCYDCSIFFILPNVGLEMDRLEQVNSTFLMQRMESFVFLGAIPIRQKKEKKTVLSILTRAEFLSQLLLLQQYVGKMW